MPYTPTIARLPFTPHPQKPSAVNACFNGFLNVLTKPLMSFKVGLVATLILTVVFFGFCTGFFFLGRFTVTKLDTNTASSPGISESIVPVIAALKEPAAHCEIVIDEIRYSLSNKKFCDSQFKESITFNEDCSSIATATKTSTDAVKIKITKKNEIVGIKKCFLFNKTAKLVKTGNVLSITTEDGLFQTERCPQSSSTL
jgi:hypothetical protein